LWLNVLYTKDEQSAYGIPNVLHYLQINLW